MLDCYFSDIVLTEFFATKSDDHVICKQRTETAN